MFTLDWLSLDGLDLSLDTCLQLSVDLVLGGCEWLAAGCCRWSWVAVGVVELSVVDQLVVLLLPGVGHCPSGSRHSASRQCQCCCLVPLSVGGRFVQPSWRVWLVINHRGTTCVPSHHLLLPAVRTSEDQRAERG